MKHRNDILHYLYPVVVFALSVFSYGFVDKNLELSSNPAYLAFVRPLQSVVNSQRGVASAVFVFIVVILFILYFLLVRFTPDVRQASQTFKKSIIALVLVSILSFPALSYDIFNYMTTARVAFYHKENPYVVMPVEIPNEPYLAFTRAANKVALYGPVWLSVTYVPYLLGTGSVWQTILVYKLLGALAYLATAYLVFRITGNIRNVVFFAFNPLVVIEVLVSAHNDIFMMLLALGATVLLSSGRKIAGAALLIASIFVKGATAVLAPILFLRITQEKAFFYSFLSLLAFYFIAAPIREELYPWYAVWFMTFAALLPWKTYGYWMTTVMVLCTGLELRHVPYMYTGSYLGITPVLRIAATFVPILLWGGYRAARGLMKRRTEK